jgi:hypothetical protein
VPYLTGERAGHQYDAALVLGQLGYAPARPAVVGLLSHPLDYYRPDALEVLAMLDAAEGRTAAST